MDEYRERGEGEWRGRRKEEEDKGRNVGKKKEERRGRVEKELNEGGVDGNE